MNRKDKIKRNRSILITLFIVVFIGGYLFFFTSKLWMSQSSEAQSLTQIGQTNRFNEREVKILRWIYSKDQAMMEVDLDIRNTAFDGFDVYEYEAVDSDGNYGDITRVVEEADFVVLQINDIDDDFSEYSLRMRLPDEYTEDKAILRLYTNINDVESVDHIDTLTVSGYQIVRLDIMIDQYEKQIEEMQEKINKEEEYQKNCEEEIKRLESKRGYQTEEERDEANALILSARRKISASEETVLSLQAEIDETMAKIDNSKKLKEVYQKEENS